MTDSDIGITLGKIRGTLLGALLGDTLGAPFEGEYPKATKKELQKYFDEKYNPSWCFRMLYKDERMEYTDDTAMTRCIANSLIECNEFDAGDMAKKFVTEYFTNTHVPRGYGAYIPTVFKKLMNSEFADVYGPAKEQFNGMGSYANGGAMRVSPVPLFYFNHKDGLNFMCEIARKTSKITHTHRDAINGTILQSLAIDQCLRLNPNEPLDGKAFLDELKTKIEKFERDEIGSGKENTTPYQDALDVAKEFLTEEQVSDEVLIKRLGNNVRAVRSVPTAIYCFLRAQIDKNLPGIKTDDPMRRTLQYVISLGGDTDTIACMAGALAGAYLSDDYCNANVLKHMKLVDEISDISTKIYEILSQR